MSLEVGSINSNITLEREVVMSTYYWSEWSWILWFGFIFLMFSSMGNWGYTYRAHRKYNDNPGGKDAVQILNERYARGEIKQEEYTRMKLEIGGSAVTAL